MCTSITDKDGRRFPMAGIFDAEARMTGVRHGPTYVIADASPDNPAFRGRVRGHEYHYSDVFPAGKPSYGFDVVRGKGIADSKDGLVRGSCIGSYMHQHVLSEEDWIGPAVERILAKRS